MIWYTYKYKIHVMIIYNAFIAVYSLAGESLEYNCHARRKLECHADTCYAWCTATWRDVPASETRGSNESTLA